MEGITDPDYVHIKRVCKDFEIKNLGEYQSQFVCPKQYIIVSWCSWEL